MRDRCLSASPFPAPRRLPGWALCLAACGLSVLAAPHAKADVTYDFTIGPNAAGFFTTGAASTVDPGYFLLTGIEFTSISGTTFGDGPFSFTNEVDTSATLASNTNSAYDPTTGAFVNHSGGNTYQDAGTIYTQNIKDLTGLGATARYAGVVSSLPDPKFTGANFFFLNGSLVIVPPTVTAAPEPASLALLGAGLLSVFGAARRTSRRG